MSSQDYETLIVLFPLEDTSELTSKNLCKALWDWKDCEMCRNNGSCLIASCPWRRFGMLDQFLRFFKATTSWSMPEEIFGGQAALRNHKDLLDIVRLLKYRPNDTRAILAEEHFASYGDAQPESIDQHRAFNLAVRVMTMVQCSVESSSRVPWRGGYKPVVWHDDESLRTLMESAFRRKDPPSLGDVHEFSIKSRLAAKTLKTVHGLKFQGTNDLRRHLLLDPETKTIHIFHYNSLLKEHLLETKDRGSGNRDIIPRQLIIETLDSLQKVLFPLDGESRRLLQNLVDQKGFDPDCTECDTVEYRRDEEDDIQYYYWGDRLLNLLKTTEDQRPQGKWWQWLDRRSKGVYLMVITLMCAAITTLLSTGSFAVGAVDASKSD